MTSYCLAVARVAAHLGTNDDETIERFLETDEGAAVATGIHGWIDKLGYLRCFSCALPQDKPLTKASAVLGDDDKCDKCGRAL